MTIIEEFRKIESASIGAIPTLARVLRNGKYKKQEIVNAFKKLVPKDEYERNERDGILEDLFSKTSL